MAIRQYKPTTPARRGMTTADTNEITEKKPAKSLTRAKKSGSGRNNQGRITVRRRGAGAKRRYRKINFGLVPGTKATVKAIEYDPNRSSRIALLNDGQGNYAYIIAGSRMKVGDTVAAGEEIEIKSGNRLPLENIPLGSTIYNIEMKRGQGGRLVRSAGTQAQLTSKEGDYVFVRLPSGEVRLIHQKCYATLGSVGNEQHQNIKIGSAGRKRRQGKRPSVRGKAMNPVDHPMGGGEGRSGPGRHPRTPWGQIAIGKKTRHRKQGSKMIVRTRKQGRR